LNILLVTGIFPPDHGGPASYVPAIASALAQKHSILGVITPSDSLDHYDLVYPFPVIRLLRRQNRVFRTLRTVATIIQHARKADIVYLNGLVLEGIIACKLLGRKKVVVKVVGDLMWERARNSGVTRDNIDVFQSSSSYGLKWQFLKKLQGWYMARADRIITPSRYLAVIINGWGISAEKIKVIYNAGDISSADLWTGTDQSYDLVTVARLIELKKLDRVIGIAAALNLKYLIVGDGPMLREWSELALRLKADVTFYGHADKDQVPGLIRQGKIFILNSDHEGLPHVVLEAKAVGVPVIATAVGGTTEIIQDGVDGYLVPSGDDAVLSRTITMLLESADDRKRIGIAGRRQVLEKFSFAAMLSETEQVLDAVSAQSNQVT